MKRPLTRRILYAVAACICALFGWRLLTPPYSYRFDHPLMTGLTKQEVINRVGEPTSIPEAGGGDVWIYQIGMDPDATIVFEEGRVSEVLTAHEKNASR